MNTIRGIKQRNVESTTEQPDATTHGTSVVGATNETTGPLKAHDSQHLTGIGYLLLAAFFLLLAFSLFLLVWNAWSRRRNHRRTTDVSENPTIDIENTSASKQRMQRRYETIEHWIITKRVLPHAELCKVINEMVLTNIPYQIRILEEGETALSPSLSCNDRSISNASPECPICMSEIRVGQIVSWSSNPQCTHGTCLLSAKLS